MSEAKELKFNAGFEHEKKDDVVKAKYTDGDIYVANSPLPQKELKALSQYQSDYSKSFLNASVEEAKSVFGKEKDVKTVITSAPFGPNKSDVIEAMVRKDVKQHIVDFNGKNPPKEITTCAITIKTKTSAGVGKSAIKEVKSQLHKDLYGDN